MQAEIQVYISFVKKICPLLTDDELDAFTRQCSVTILKNKEVYIQAGDVPAELGFIATGLIRSFCIDNDKQERTMRFFADNSYVSDYTALVTGQSTSYTFQCIEPTTVVRIPYSAILQSYEDSHRFERLGRLVTQKVLEMQQARIESFLFQSAEQRYLNFIDQYPDVFGRINLSHLCSYLGVRRQTLTRIRHKLSRQ